MGQYQKIALIPAYEPEEGFILLLRELREYEFQIVVVNDGSSPQSRPLFSEAEHYAVVLEHERNRGKGCALKTGLHYIGEHFAGPFIVVTMDADGQHKAKDAVRVCEEAGRHPEALVLGSRRFTGKVPLRSRFGNTVTRYVFRIFSGNSVRDTQTGLRGFSDRRLPELLCVPGERYEYEMNVLMAFSRNRRPIREVEIETVYLEGNASSHFDAVRDSWRIYRDILKFSASSLCSFAVDYVLFCTLGAITGRLVFSNITARLMSASLNYTINRVLVFQSKASLWKTAVQYVLLASAILLCNTALLTALVRTGLAGWLAKLLTELILFLASWFVQSRWIFGRKEVQYENA